MSAVLIALGLLVLVAFLFLLACGRLSALGDEASERMFPEPIEGMDAMTDVEFFAHVDDRGEFHLDPFRMSTEPYPAVTSD